MTFFICDNTVIISKTLFNTDTRIALYRRSSNIRNSTVIGVNGYVVLEINAQRGYEITTIQNLPQVMQAIPVVDTVRGVHCASKLLR